jgi:hypothetical protein
VPVTSYRSRRRIASPISRSRSPVPDRGADVDRRITAIAAQPLPRLSPRWNREPSLDKTAPSTFDEGDLPMEAFVTEATESHAGGIQ